jgi:hypothetical protein
LTFFLLAGFGARGNVLHEAHVPIVAASLFDVAGLLLYSTDGHLLMYDLLFLNFCGSDIIDFKFHRLYLGSFRQHILGALDLLRGASFRDAGPSFGLPVLVLAWIVRLSFAGPPLEPLRGLRCHLQFDGRISQKLFEILIDALRWLLIELQKSGCLVFVMSIEVLLQFIVMSLELHTTYPAVLLVPPVLHSGEFAFYFQDI